MTLNHNTNKAFHSYSISIEEILQEKKEIL